MRDLIDDDGENRAVRCFLVLYGGNVSVDIGRMREHLKMSGFDKHWPDWAEQAHGQTHLTKGGAQDWLRYLFALERPNDNVSKTGCTVLPRKKLK